MEISYWITNKRNGHTQQTPAIPDLRIHVPPELPTYRRLNAIHCGDSRMETRMRAASLEDSCRYLRQKPPPLTLIDEVHDTGVVTAAQAAELRQFIAQLGDHPYLRDETLLLLEAAGYVSTGNLT